MTPGSTPPAIPLTPELRNAYEELYAHFEEAIENETHPALHASLMVLQDAVAKIISLDNEARIKGNTMAFADLLKQINTTNSGLNDLQGQINKVASDLNKYAGILSGIGKVISLVPGI